MTTIRGSEVPASGPEGFDATMERLADRAGRPNSVSAMLSLIRAERKKVEALTARLEAAKPEER